MVNWFTIFMTYVVVWWVVLFMTLPFGATPPAETGQGHSAGAPAKTHLAKKAAVTTVLAALVTWAFFALTAGFLVVPE